MPVKVLVPYNFTVNDEKAIEFVGHRYAGKSEAEITLFHAFSQPPEVDIRKDPIMVKINRNLSYLRQQHEKKKNALGNVKKELMIRGIADHRIHCLFQPIGHDIAEDIIRLWEIKKFDVVVLNRNPGNIINYFSRSISKRIVQYKQGDIGVHIVN